MNCTEDGEPLGENPPIDTLTDTHARHAIEQLAQRQAQALNAVRALHRSINLVTCEECGVTPNTCVCEGDPYTIIRAVCKECGQDEDKEWTYYPCATVRAIEAAGA